LTLRAIRKWSVDQWDIIGAYLNAVLDNRVIFMKQPTSHEYQSPDSVEHVALILKALYGLRQAGHL
jgi:hypothetical protein